MSQENKKVSDVELSNSILLCLEVKNLFEMYSYRIISPEMFLERISEVISNYSNPS